MMNSIYAMALRAFAFWLILMLVLQETKANVTVYNTVYDFVTDVVVVTFAAPRPFLGHHHTTSAYGLDSSSFPEASSTAASSSDYELAISSSSEVESTPVLRSSSLSSFSTLALQSLASSSTLLASSVSSTSGETSSSAENTPSAGFSYNSAADTGAYHIVHDYNFTNWFSSFTYEDQHDPTNGSVQYVNLATAQAQGLTKIIDDKVYLGVDNFTVISDIVDPHRQSIWLESVDKFTHGLLIGDFEHVPGSVCGTWPAFWTIRQTDAEGPYGEIDIMESWNDRTTSFTTLHTAENCSFYPDLTTQVGTLNNNNTNCTLANDVGCSIAGADDSYGAAFNPGGGGVYAMEWTSAFIKIWMFRRANIPADITSGEPDPTTWTLPIANFQNGTNCNIDASFPQQTIYFDTTFCGACAGGKGWTDWSNCSKDTGMKTCEEYVASEPAAFTDAYWLINSVKVYQTT